MDVENAGRVAFRHAARSAGTTRKIDDQGRDAVAGGSGGAPDRDLRRPALEPERNELDLARRQLSGVGEIDQQNLRVGFRAGRLSAFMGWMGDFASGHAPLLDERIDAVQKLPFAAETPRSMLVDSLMS